MRLEIRNMTIGFDGVDALKDINVTIESGEFVSLIGPSGCGKSTLFSTIGGLLTPDSGEILLDENNINGKRGFMGYMPQDASLLPWRTVLENVLLSQELNNQSDLARADEMLKLAKLKEYKNHYPKTLSGGMKQRVSFVRALLTNRDILLLDEPFSALDSFTKEKMQSWLLEIWQDRKNSIFFITHDIDEAIFLSNKIVIMSKDGNIVDTIKVPLIYPKDRLSNDFLQFKKIVTNRAMQG